MSATETSDASSQSVAALLGMPEATPWWRRKRNLIAGALGLGVLVVVYLVWGGGAQKAATHFVTQNIHKGDITLSVAANGTLVPTRQVNIGSELSGTVREVLVDVNDRVKKGQVLVVLDTARLQDQVTTARAGLLAAQAQLVQTQATVQEAQATLNRLQEVARLSGGKVPSATELDVARANLARAQASENSARAAVTQAQATLSTNETNLGKASIRSPIDGVVLSRSVEPGNAVAASLQAVTLLSLAQDLTQLELQVNVDEADVGAVAVGQKASFTVSAYPARPYPATITRVAYGSTKTDNVITYITYMDVNNSDLSLRPGMTASATIVATERKGVLLVPNTALRFTPANVESGKGSNSILSRMFPRPPSSKAKTVKTDVASGTRTLWVLRNGQPQALSVTTGISDGRLTEVSGEGVSEGLPVITEQRSQNNPKAEP